MTTDVPSQMRRNSSLVAAGIALSRIAGVVREAVIAFFLGADLGADAFRAALRIPNFLQNLLGEGVLSAAFIPTYSRLIAEGRDAEAGRVAGAIATLLTALAGVLVVVAVAFARPLTAVLAAGFTGERFELTVTLVRIMTPGIGVLVLSAWCLGILNSHGRFFLSYVAPVLWNVGIVATATTVLTLGSMQPALAFGWGVVLGSVLQFGVQLPAVLRLAGGTIRPSFEVRLPGVVEVARAFGPVVAGRGTVQIGALLDLFVASFLAVGALSVLGYAQTLYLLPIGLFGMSVAAAELPALSTLDADGRSGLHSRLDAGLARSAFFVVGTTVGYLLLAGPIIALLFGRGEFGPATTRQVALVLGAYSLGLLPATSSRLLQSLLYATGNPRTPARVAAIRVVVALVVALPLMFNLDRFVVDLEASFGIALADGARLPAFTPIDPAVRGGLSNQLRLGAVGLAIGSAAGSWIEYLLLRRSVARRFTAPRLGGGTLGRLLGAACLAALVAVVLLQLPLDRTAARLLVVGVGAGFAYLTCTWASGVPEARALAQLGRARSR